VAPIQEDNPFGVTNGTIPGGRCAVVRHHGSHDSLSESARYLYRDWLPASGEELRDFPMYFHYLKFVHQVAVHELLTDIYHYSAMLLKLMQLYRGTAIRAPSANDGTQSGDKGATYCR
jgi:hypothetical protein